MKKTEGLLIGIIIIFLSIHLFTMHSKLLYHLNPDKIIEALNYKFSLDLFNDKMVVSTLSAIAYSLITALILAIFVKYKKVFLLSVISFAILDGIGVFVYYNVGIEKDDFILFGSLYYALYTIFIIVSLGLYRNLMYKDAELNKNIDKSISELNVIQTVNKMNNLTNLDCKIGDWDMITIDEKVIQLKKDGLSQTKIAKELNISQPKVSRILKKHNS